MPTIVQQNQIKTNTSTNVSILDENPKSRIQQTQMETNNDVISVLDETEEKLIDESELQQLLLLAETKSFESPVSSESNKPVIKKVDCPDCAIQFCTVTNLNIHILSNHKIKFCQCKVCCENVELEKNHSVLIQKQNHFVKTLQEKSIRSSTSSPQRFTSPQQGHKFSSTTEGSRPLTILYCEVCRKTFNDDTSFNAHQTQCFAMPLRKRVKRSNNTNTNYQATNNERTNRKDQDTKHGRNNTNHQDTNNKRTNRRDQDTKHGRTNTNHQDTNNKRTNRRDQDTKHGRTNTNHQDTNNKRTNRRDQDTKRGRTNTNHQDTNNKRTNRRDQDTKHGRTNTNHQDTNNKRTNRRDQGTKRGRTNTNHQDTNNKRTNRRDQDTKHGRTNTNHQDTNNKRTNRRDHDTKHGRNNTNQMTVRYQIAQAYKNCVYTDPITGVKSHVCRFCDVKFSTRTVLMRHEAGFCRSNINIDDLSLVRCEACCKQFLCTPTLHRHTSSFCPKTRESIFICKPCGRKFKTKLDLDKHFNAGHSKTYTCDYCKRDFREKHHVKRHIMRHTETTRYSCPICKRKFERYLKMRDHYERHKQAKYSCKVCTNQFKNRTLMKRHMDGVCSEDSAKRRPFLCDICKGRFPNKKLIKLHIIRSHLQNYPCEICNTNFGDESSLSTHLIRHSRRYFCEICKKSFSNKSQCLIHKKTHLRVTCECGQNFKLCYKYHNHRKYLCPMTTGKDLKDVVKTDEKLSQTFRDNIVKSVAGKQKPTIVKTKNKLKLKGNKKDGKILNSIEDSKTDDKRTNHKKSIYENSNDKHDVKTNMEDVKEPTNNKEKSGINKIEVNASEKLNLNTRPRKRKMDEVMSKIFLILKVDLSKDNKFLEEISNISK